MSGESSSRWINQLITCLTFRQVFHGLTGDWWVSETKISKSGLQMHYVTSAVKWLVLSVCEATIVSNCLLLKGFRCPSSIIKPCIYAGVDSSLVTLKKRHKREKRCLQLHLSNGFHQWYQSCAQLSWWWSSCHHWTNCLLERMNVMIRDVAECFQRNLGGGPWFKLFFFGKVTCNIFSL